MMRSWVTPLKAAARRPRSRTFTSTNNKNSMFLQNQQNLRLKYSRKEVQLMVNEASSVRVGLCRVVNAMGLPRSHISLARGFSTALRQQLTKEISHLETWFASKIPRGFEKFYPKKNKTSAAAGKASGGGVNGGTKRSKSSSSSNKRGSSSSKKGGVGGPGKPNAPSTPPSVQEVLILGLGASLLLIMTNPKVDDIEIDWQTFKTNLLASGEVERIVVVNKQKAKVVLRSDLNIKQRQKNQVSSYSQNNHSDMVETQRDPYMMDTDRGDPAASGDKYASPSSPPISGGYSGPTIGSRPGSSKRSTYYFTIGSIESFERKLEITQRELGISTSEFVPVQYTSETSYSSELIKFAPTLLIVGLWLYMMRGMSGGMGGMGGGGGKMGDIFKIGKSNAKKQLDNNRSKITFKDVAGVDEAKVEVMEVRVKQCYSIYFLQNTNYCFLELYWNFFGITYIILCFFST
jgi:AFG3 family protein